MWGETKFHLPEYPRSGSKAMSVEREEEEWTKVSVNNGQYIYLKQKWAHSFHSISWPYWQWFWSRWLPRTSLFSLSSFYIYCFSPTSGKLPRMKFCWSRRLACTTHGGGRSEAGHCFHLLFFFFLSSSTPSAFLPLRRSSRGWNNFPPNILA